MDNNSNAVTAEVVYKDINNNKLIDSRKITGPDNHVVNPNNYKKYIPNAYRFAKFGRFNQNLKDHDVDVIYVKKSGDDSKSKGSIVIDYINANNQLISHNKFTSQVGSPFNISQCRATIPQGYKLDRFLTGKKINAFKANSQIIVAQVSKIHYANVSIKYLADGKTVGQAHAKGVLGAPFNLSRYTNNVPKGYKFVKVLSSVAKTFKQDREVDVKVNKIVKPRPKAVKKPANGLANGSQKGPKEIGEILMKLASSLRDLGMMISKSKKL